MGSCGTGFTGEEQKRLIIYWFDQEKKASIQLKTFDSKFIAPFGRSNASLIPLHSIHFTVRQSLIVISYFISLIDQIFYCTGTTYNNEFGVRLKPRERKRSRWRMDGTCPYWPFTFVIGIVAGAVDALALHTNFHTHSQCVFCGLVMAHSASTKCDRFQLNFLFRAREHISLRYLSAAMHTIQPESAAYGGQEGTIPSALSFVFQFAAIFSIYLWQSHARAHFWWAHFIFIVLG